MILSIVLSKEIISACLFDAQKPLEPKFYSILLNRDFIIDKSIPVINSSDIKKFIKKGFDLSFEDFKESIYLTSIDKNIILPQLDEVKNIDFQELLMGFNYILVNLDSDFVKQYESRFETYWNEILTRLDNGIWLTGELNQLIDSSLIQEALGSIIENSSFVYANPFNHIKEAELSKYFKPILKDLPDFSSKSRLIQINYDQDLKYFALGVALNLAGINTHKFFKENPIPVDVNIFNLKSLKNFKILKNDEDIEEGIKPDKVLMATTNREDRIKFSSSSLKAEITGSVLYIFDNRTNEKK